MPGRDRVPRAPVAQAGHELIIASRDPERARAKAAEVVVLTVPATGPATLTMLLAGLDLS